MKLYPVLILHPMSIIFTIMVLCVTFPYSYYLLAHVGNSHPLIIAAIANFLFRMLIISTTKL